MSTDDLYSTWQGSQERMERAVSISPCSSPCLPLALSPTRSGAAQSLGTRCRNAPRDLHPSGCWEGAEQSCWVVPPPLLPQNTANTKGAEGRLNRSPEQLLSACLVPCNGWGDPSCAHPKLLDLNNPLSHVSLGLWGLRFPTLKFPIRLKGLALPLPTSPWSGQPARAVVSVFPLAQPRSVLQWQPQPPLHWQEEHPFNSCNAQSRSREQTPAAASGSAELQHQADSTEFFDTLLKPVSNSLLAIPARREGSANRSSAVVQKRHPWKRLLQKCNWHPLRKKVY